ncbi:MAG TPA: hypothetical protein VNX46_18455 [Candidatus Acidoferrum sp.]|nr:hypothetical protein [Candidatus Acidoferrum sp.]
MSLWENQLLQIDQEDKLNSAKTGARPLRNKIKTERFKKYRGQSERGFLVF